MTALAGAIAVDLYGLLKSAASRLASGTGVVGLIQAPLALDLTPTARRTAWHGFWPILHRDYVVEYQAVLSNRSEDGGRRLTAQLVCAAGFLARVSLPPAVRPRIVDSGDVTSWSDWSHSTESKVLAFEFDSPPRGTFVSFGVAVISPDGFTPDNALSIQVMLPDGILSAVGKPVTWK